MKPQFTKTADAEAYGHPVKLIGEVYSEPFKRSADHEIYTQVRIEAPNGFTLHPSFYGQVIMTETEMEKELDYIKNKMLEKPEIYFPEYKKEDNELSKSS